LSNENYKQIEDSRVIQIEEDTRQRY